MAINWRKSTNPTEIMEAIKDLKKIDKFYVLEYFGIEKRDAQVLSKLLYSEYYTPEEIISRGYKYYNKWTYELTRKMLLEYVNQVWQNLDNAKDIINARIGLFASDIEEYEMKLDYFKKRNPQLYRQLVEEMLKLGKDGVCACFESLRGDFEQNKKLIVKLAVRYPYLRKRLDNNNTKERIVLYIVDNIIVNNSQNQDWRTEENAQLIMFKANNNNKWEILEYFAANNPKTFNTIINNYTTTNDSNKKVCYIRDEVLSHYQDADLDAMPAPLREYILKLKQEVVNLQYAKEKRKEDRAQMKTRRLLAWEKNGSVVSLFKLGHISPGSKGDYERILKRYLDEKISVIEFCSKYRIDSHDGFRKMLDKFSAEDETYAEQIKTQLDESKAKFLEEVGRILYDICVKGESVGQFTIHSKSLPLSKLQDFAERSFINKNYYETLALRVVDYYYERLNSYTTSIEPQNISNMLTVNEIRFIVGPENYNLMLQGKQVDVDAIFTKRVERLYSSHLQLMNKKVSGAGRDTISKRLIKYNTRFFKKEYLKDKTTIQTESGKMVEVTEEMVDMALHYAFCKGLYISNAVMNALIRAVANGKINNLQEMRTSKERMARRALTLVKDITDIDEYFKTMASKQNLI